MIGTIAPGLIACLAGSAPARAQDSSVTGSSVLVKDSTAPGRPILPPVTSAAQPSRLINDSIPHPAPGILELRASISGRTLYVMRGDSLLAEYPVAVGADEHPTPRGDFRIKRIVWNPRWVPPDAAWARGKSAKDPGSPSNPMKLVKIFFQEPDYYIHGTSALESLGKAESHGCLRMDPDQAAEVARIIMEHGGQPREENWFWRVLHFRREEKTVSLDNPIRIVVAD
ncbi:MAG: L,D-transpeptidase family protein [Gemmatimonadaceae bacterium]|nr:L,D-transpeptidase family protein [Gemmatimonadaceae bacterium]